MAAEIHIDPASFEFRHHAIEIYQQLLREQPVCRLDNGRYLLCRHADVLRALTDLKSYRRPYEWSVATKSEGPFREFTRNNMIAMNPPDNTRFRRAMARTFAPRRIEQMIPGMRLTCDALIDEMAKSDTCDFIEAFALPLPVAIICQMLGIPASDQHLFAHSSATMLAGMELAATPEERLAADEATMTLYRYLEDVVASRTSKGDDLLSTLIEAAEGASISPAEVVWGAITLLIAGHETTTHLLGNGMLALIRNPEQLALLRARPDLTDNAVEEFLRFDPSVYVLFRETAVDVVVGDISIPKGTFLVLSLAAANRDPAVFADPDRLDIERPNAKAHLAFGAGFHVCLGQAVARVEARVAFETLLRRVKDIGLENEPTAREGLMFKGNYTLPIRYSVD